MPKQIRIPEPENELSFIDVHCHLPFPRPKKNDSLPPDEIQYEQFFKIGGLYIITSSIDLITLDMILNFINGKENIGFTCGWAPQTVTYTPKKKHDEEFKKWLDFIMNSQEKYIGIGEIGLDFHHARTLEQRNKQVDIFKEILEKTKNLKKPYILHVRNPTEKEFDRDHPNHRFNAEDGAIKEIINLLKEFNIDFKKIMFHCFSGPQNYGKSLSEKGCILSVPSSAYGFKRWREVTKQAPLNSLVTETDSYYQHPYLRGPVNVPANARYAIAAIAFSHGVSQKKVAEITVQNAIRFFNLKIKK